MGYVEGKSKEQILSEIQGTAKPGSVVHELQKAAIIVRCTQDLEIKLGELTASINLASKQSEELNRKLLWLNVILVSATGIGAIAMVIAALAALK